MAGYGTRRRLNWARWVMVASVTAGVLGSGVLVWQTSQAAFTATTHSPANQWAAGLAALNDNDANAALFTATGLKPTSTGLRCIRVTYTGNTSSGAVKMWGSALTDANGLGAMLSIKIDSGTGSAADCADFAGGSALMADTPLATFAAARTSYANGYPTGWSPTTVDTTRTYRFTYTLSASAPDSLEGDSAHLAFNWETRTA